MDEWIKNVLAALPASSGAPPEVGKLLTKLCSSFLLQKSESQKELDDLLDSIIVDSPSEEKAGTEVSSLNSLLHTIAVVQLPMPYTDRDVWTS